MAEHNLVKPDRAFVQELVALGGGSLKKCYQCATCSVTCNLSPADRPFPRKEMAWAQWGLKDKLLADPDVWLCHRCNDCSVHCPRGAVPGDVMAAVRDASVRRYSTPRFFSNMFGRPGFLPLLLLLPAVLMAVVLGATGHLNIPAGEVEYGNFFPHLPLQLFFGGFVALALVISAVGAARYWRAMKLQMPPKGETNSLSGSVVGVVKDILTHKRFRNCDEDRGRTYSHLLTFYGFLGLFVTTVGAVVALYIFDAYPLSIFHPIKLLGNLSTIAMLIGLTWIVYDRTRKSARTQNSTTSDWTFIGLLYGLVLTGILVEVFRYADVPAAAYPTYFIHLMFVFSVLIYLPYSRFAHLIYRTVALVYAKYIGREPAEVTQEAVSR